MKQQISLYPETATQEITPEQEKELLGWCEKIKALSGGTASCSDALDQLGYHRCAMDPEIAPFFPRKGQNVWFGIHNARFQYYWLSPKMPEVRDTVDVEYYDGIRPGYVLTYGTECGDRGSTIGDVISTYASLKGAVGVVSENPIRDLERIRPLSILPFGKNACPTDGNGRFLWIEYNCIIQVGGVWVEPFDIIFGDMDGVVVIPKHLAQKTYELAKQLCEKEDGMKRDFEEHKELSFLEVLKKNGRRC